MTIGVASVEMAVNSPPPGGEGLGVGGLPAFIVLREEGVPTSTSLRSPPPCPSPTSCRRHAYGVTGEGTIGWESSSSFRAERCKLLTNPPLRCTDWGSLR